MLEVGQSHPYEAITRHIVEWIACLVRQDFTAANQYIDDFEGDDRIENYLAIEGDDGPIEAIDPTDDEWWQISFNPSHDADGAILVDAYVPLAGEYRPMNACFVFTPVQGGFRITFRYCKPS